MKLDKQRISSLFALLTDIDDAQLERWQPILSVNGQKLESQIKANVDIARNMERLCMAAAANAYFDYTMLSSSQGKGSEEIKVGDITMRSSGDVVDAASTRDFFLAEVADLLTIPTGFAFKTTGDAL